MSDEARLPSADDCTARVLIHESQFPAAVQRDLRESLQSRRLNHKFLYEGYRQARRWLALHEAHSPARRDPGAAGIYARAFESVSARFDGANVHVVALGCGGGQKEARLIQLLAPRARQIACTMCDVSVALALTAREAALRIAPALPCDAVVCDLATATNLEGLFAGKSEHSRLITLFGMLPNFEPQTILRQLASLARTGDRVLVSANLAPGPDYERGIQAVLPQYDNALTREWLWGFLTDLGFDPNNAGMQFKVTGAELKRIEANATFTRDTTIQVEGESFPFLAGETFQVFFSYRYTPQLVRHELGRHGFAVEEEWISSNGEEGVFLASFGQQAKPSSTA